MRSFFVLIYMELKPPEYLFDKIINRIKKEQQFLNLRKRLIFFSAGTIGSIIAFIPTFSAVRADLAESGIIHFVSLMFSDFAMTIALWKDFAFSILESLPVISIAVLLATIFVFFGCVKFLIEDITVIFAQPRLINN